jgi:hypothetical protein
MTVIEQWIDARVTEAEEYLIGQWGEEDHEDQYQAVLQEILGPFADYLRGAVETLALIRTTLEGVDPHDDKQSTQVRVAEALRLLGALPSPRTNLTKEDR